MNDESVKAEGIAAASELHTNSRDDSKPEAASVGAVTDDAHAQVLSTVQKEGMLAGYKDNVTAATVGSVNAQTDADSPIISSHSSSPEAMVRETEQAVQA